MLKKILVGCGILFIFLVLVGACGAFLSDGECDFKLEDFNGDGKVTAVDHDYKVELEERCEDGM